MKTIQSYQEATPLKEKEFVVEFIKPEVLKDPAPIFYNALMNLRDKIGSDELKKNIKTFCENWGLHSGYYVTFKEDDKHIVFTHVSI